jgi:hypothetical protein
MMVPLTESLYAPGALGSTEKVLLDIGTGYFVEVRAQKASAQKSERRDGRALGGCRTALRARTGCVRRACA